MGSLSKHYRELREAALLPCQRSLHWLRFDPHIVLQEAARTIFHDDLPRLDFRFAEQKTLAWIRGDGLAAFIQIHECLNHPETPEVVISYVLKHELLHLVIPPRKVGRKVRKHPPEFWEEEKVVSPERHDASLWIHANYLGNLKTVRSMEQIRVLKGWRGQ